MTTDNRASEPNKYAGFLARQNHQRDSHRGIGVKCLCGRLFDLDADHALHQVDEILRAALEAAEGAGEAPQEPCPQPCEHLSAEDAREGRDCREHPCICPTAPTSDREKLVEEARAVAGPKSLYAHTSVAHLLIRLADALVAAQGAAPQVESADCDRDRMGICKRCGMGWDARKVLDGDFACSVLPSSGIDEDKLAEVIGYAYNSEHHDPATHAARAVAELLKVQGGESRGE